MKNLVIMAGLAALLFSCNDETKESTTTVTGTETSTSANAAKRNSAEGDVTYRDGKVMVWRNGQWVEAENDVELENGVVVRKNGRIVRNGEEVEFREGVVVSREGDFFDDAGNAIDEGWEGLKKGFKKSKEEVKEVFQDDDKNKNNQ